MSREVKVVKKPVGLLDRLETLAKIVSLVAVPTLIGYFGARIQANTATRNNDLQLAVGILAKPNSETTAESRTLARSIVNKYTDAHLADDATLAADVPAATPGANATPSPVAGVNVPWEIHPFDSGSEAAKVLTVQHADPNTIYSAIYAGKDIWVWWKPGQLEYTYTYTYVLWYPTLVPLPDTSVSSSGLTRRIPVGFGVANGRTVFLFFEATRLSSAPTPK